MSLNTLLDKRYLASELQLELLSFQVKFARCHWHWHWQTRTRRLAVGGQGQSDSESVPVKYISDIKTKVPQFQCHFQTSTVSVAVLSEFQVET